MKKRGIIDKLISAAGSILFVGLIRTDAPAWQLLILFVFMYELKQELAGRCARKRVKTAGVTISRLPGGTPGDGQEPGSGGP